MSRRAGGLHRPVKSRDYETPSDYLLAVIRRLMAVSLCAIIALVPAAICAWHFHPDPAFGWGLLAAVPVVGVVDLVGYLGMIDL